MVTNCSTCCCSRPRRAPEGARWPTVRQGLALVRDGLQTRRGRVGQNLSARWWQLGDLAVTELAGYALIIVAGQLRPSIDEYRSGGHVVSWLAEEAVTATILVLLIAAVLWRRRSVAAGLGATSAAVAALMNANSLSYDLAAATFWFFAGGFVVGRLDVRPLYVVIAVLCLAHLWALVDPGVVFVVAALLVPPILAAISVGLLNSPSGKVIAVETLLRLIVVG